ncbi:MAG: exodeoxyribonuclease III, partial [Alphaproteobacteria bacterium]|nr:exodeoxyribonuclease III [Alphaproteobacteria bacterium]
KQLLNVVSHTPIEVDHLGRVQAAHDWVDAVRHFIPEDERVYSWWSYRNRDWRASNRGRRLDHIWVTPALKKHLGAIEVLERIRDWKQPSDHCPVALELTG